jgi:hypothetical protein
LFNIEISWKKFHLIFRNLIEYTFLFLVRAAFHIINFVCEHSEQWYPQIVLLVLLWHPTNIKLYPPLALISLMHKKSCPHCHYFHSIFHRRMYIRLLARRNTCSVWPALIPLNILFHFCLLWSNLLYRNILHSVIQISYAFILLVLIGIRPIPWPCLIFHEILVVDLLALSPTLGWRTTHCRFSGTASSIYLQLSSIYQGDSLLRLQHQDAPRRGDSKK